jgi:hypothetical protein
LATALAEEPAMMARETERMLSKPYYVSLAHQSHSYVTRGLYAEQLERWFTCFDRSQFLIERSEDLFRDPASVYDRTLSFLGLAPFRPHAFEKLNVGNKPEVAPPEARALLAPHFTEANARLQQLLGRDMGW